MNRKESVLTKIISGSLWDLPSPSSMSYFWNFGSTLGFCLVIQILTGLILSMHYTAFAEESFNSIMLIMRDVWKGWMLRMMHMNGASMFFVFIYLHLFRGMFFMSSLHKTVWISGTAILILLMAISFLGYVLPWGQMSYWAVAVITNLFSVIPIVGNEIVFWIWGGFSVSGPTLSRFYTLHFLMPFVLAAMVVLHLLSLHKEGSSNPLGVTSNMDKLEFHPYFSIKDLFFLVLVLMSSLLLSFYYPYIMGDSVNNIPANAMQTPAHIQPEWYFLTSYAILRGLPSKAAGVIALAMSVSVYFFLPLFVSNSAPKFSMYRNFMFWVILATFFFLMYMGAMPAEEPYVFMSKIGAVMFFSSILIINM